MDIPSFVYPFILGHLGYFWFGAIINKEAINITYRSLCEHTFSFLLDKYLGVELLYGKCMSNFIRKKWLYHFAFSSEMYEF